MMSCQVEWPIEEAEQGEEAATDEWWRHKIEADRSGAKEWG